MSDVVAPVDVSTTSEATPPDPPASSVASTVERVTNVVVLVASAVLLFMVSASISGPPRAVAAVVFVLLVPGWAVSSWWKGLDVASRLAISVGISLAICILAGSAGLVLQLWSPAGTLWVLAPASMLMLGIGNRGRSESTASDEVAEPIWVGEVELARPLQAVAVLAAPTEEQRRALLLVRLHGTPLGFCEVSLGGDGAVDRTLLAMQILEELWEPILAHLALEGRSPQDAQALEWARDQILTGFGAKCTSKAATALVPFTVVMCTRDRPELARLALHRLGQLDYADYEVVLVDNAPSDDATRQAFEDEVGGDERFRYVREPRPGLSRARNRGLSVARHRHVAFTDDDASADPSWLSGLARGFDRDPGVACVTGLVPSAQLDTEAQQYFHDRVWWSSSLEPQLYRRTPSPGDSPLHPYRMGVFGTGANFAVDREVAQSLGGFSELLGAGSPSRGGAEDGDFFVRVLLGDNLLAYEPSAIVWHRARPGREELREQLEEYGRGIPITGLKWLADPAMRADVLRRVPRAFAYYLGLLWNRGYAGESKRAGMALVELKGMLLGPASFVRGVVAERKERVN
ncbi:MAG: glycosyl transferase family 2 [Acidimicrobiaceae bacterium]|nr:glycosyl transferase family 2 [Acidimicrobiaceae bacterium]